MRHEDIRRTGFTTVELLVLVLILLVLLSIFVPYLLGLRESSRRIACANNLQQIREALRSYAESFGSVYPRTVYDGVGNPNGYTAYTGRDANPFATVIAPPSTQPEATTAPATTTSTSPSTTTSAEAFVSGRVEPNDVTASLWLLVRRGLLSNTKVFICPSSDKTRDPAEDLTRFGNFAGPQYLSYSYASPFSAAPDYRLDDTRASDFVLVADMNPGRDLPDHDVVSPPWNAPPLERAKANSRNHRKAGENVLYVQGNVEWTTTPYCGNGRRLDDRTGRYAQFGDNIYTALSPRPLIGSAPPEVKGPPAYGNGVIGRHVAPAWRDDSYLLPTEQDGAEKTEKSETRSQK